MAEKIIMILCCVLCGLPFWLLATVGRKGKEPLNFWSGDDRLKAKIEDVAAYNHAMGKMYFVYGSLFILAAVLAVFSMAAAVVLLILNCTLGLFLIYKGYGRILRRFEINKK